VLKRGGEENMPRKSAKNLGMAIISLAHPPTGALLKVLDEAQKFVAQPRRKRKRR
jgi:hypothetical protein